MSEWGWLCRRGGEDVGFLVRATVSSPLHFSRVSLHRLRQQNGLDLAKPPQLIGGSALKDYMLIPVHALSITSGRSRPPLRTDKKR
jgi:hypothetical protein